MKKLPKCGEVYCEVCGDCIHCYGEFPCIDDGEHSYVIPTEGDEDTDADEYFELKAHAEGW